MCSCANGDMGGGAGFEVAYANVQYAALSETDPIGLSLPGMYDDGLVNMPDNWNRYFSENWQAYTQPDPMMAEPRYAHLLMAAGLSNPMYGYAGVNPNGYVDLTGLWTIFIGYGVFGQFIWGGQAAAGVVFGTGGVGISVSGDVRSGPDFAIGAGVLASYSPNGTVSTSCGGEVGLAADVGPVEGGVNMQMPINDNGASYGPYLSGYGPGGGIGVTTFEGVYGTTKL